MSNHPRLRLGTHLLTSVVVGKLLKESITVDVGRGGISLTGSLRRVVVAEERPGVGTCQSVVVKAQLFNYSRPPFQILTHTV